MLVNVTSQRLCALQHGRTLSARVPPALDDGVPIALDDLMGAPHVLREAFHVKLLVALMALLHAAFTPAHRLVMEALLRVGKGLLAALVPARERS